jgi:hypothetical protein
MGTQFGWEELVLLKKREDARAAQNIPRRVPGLTQSYIDRDAWTRLNVAPAKIMQQIPVLREQHDHLSTGAPGTEKTAEVHAYLSALHSLFETGLLSKEIVNANQHKPLDNILEGYAYFEEWMRNLILQDIGFQPSRSTQREFLAWQTWDLLRVCVFGIQGLCRQFFAKYPQHFLVFSRINGSAVESLFAQFKHAAGNKLSSLNYTTARKAVLVKANVDGRHMTNRFHRDVPLFVRDSVL